MGSEVKLEDLQRQSTLRLQVCRLSIILEEYDYMDGDVSTRHWKVDKIGDLLFTVEATSVTRSASSRKSCPACIDKSVNDWKVLLSSSPTLSQEMWKAVPS